MSESRATHFTARRRSTNCQTRAVPSADAVTSPRRRDLEVPRPPGPAADPAIPDAALEKPVAEPSWPSTNVSSSSAPLAAGAAAARGRRTDGCHLTSYTRSVWPVASPRSSPVSGSKILTGNERSARSAQAAARNAPSSVKRRHMQPVRPEGTVRMNAVGTRQGSVGRRLRSSARAAASATSRRGLAVSSGAASAP